MGNKYVGLMVRYETWQRFDNMASKEKADTKDLIEGVLLNFLKENEARTESVLMKRKIELEVNKVVDFIKNLDS